MDEKTEELREIFVEVTDEETVTETQEEAHGSLTEDEQQTNERIEGVIARMRKKYEFWTDLPDERLREVVRGFYAGRSDGKLAEDLEVSADEVFHARMDLHLLRKEDTDAPFDLVDLRDLLVDDRSTGEVADHLDAPPSTVRRYQAVVEAEDRARRVSHRFRSEFEDALPDAELSARLTADAREDGLEEATDGMETNVSF